MKSNLKKFLILIPVAVGALACFAACGEHKHTYSENWSHNAQYHWHGATCEHSEEMADKAAHTFKLNASKSTVTCTEDGIGVYECECGYSYMQNESAGHLIEYIGGKAATCTEDGATPREVCSRCDYVKESVVIPATGHKYSTAWVWDGVEHWHPASCGHDLKTNEEVHEFDGDGFCKCGLSQAGDPANFNWKRVGNSYTITGLSQTAIESGETVLMIPSIYDGRDVTAIADFAFQYNTTITSVNIPAGVTEIGKQAFNGCTALQSVNIPNGVTTIGDNTFLNCERLSTVKMSSAISYIGSQAFANCTSLTSITLSEGVEFIGMKAFKNTGLTSIELPDSVTYLGAYAFSDCSALTSAKIGSGITYTVGEWFSGCGALESLTLPFVGSRMYSEIAASTHLGYIFGTTAPKAADADKYEAVTVTEKGKSHTYYIPKSLKNVTILGGTYDEWKANPITGEDEKTTKTYTIPANAFSGCSMLTEITLAEGVLEETDAFAGCDATVTRLGSGS